MLRTQYLSDLVILGNLSLKALNMFKWLRLFEYGWICDGGDYSPHWIWLYVEAISWPIKKQ